MSAKGGYQTTQNRGGAMSAVSWFGFGVTACDRGDLDRRLRADRQVTP